MKLNKNICKKCINTRFYFKWDNQDDMYWTKERKVLCRMNGVDAKGNDKPRKTVPTVCPYNLEHIVMNENETK